MLTPVLLSHHRRASQLALAAHPRAHRLQDIAVLTFTVLRAIAPEYLGRVVPVADLPGRLTLRSVSPNRLVVPPFKLSTIDSRWLVLKSGIVCRKLLHRQLCSQPSVEGR